MARRSQARYHHRMPRVTDLGITIGLLPPGPTGSVLDVPGVGLWHATVWRDEAPPPAGRGVARTGVTVLDPGGDLFSSPVAAGGAVLNGAGECTGMVAVREWGLVESPVFLTSTMQVGRVYDAACELLISEQPAIGVQDVGCPPEGCCRGRSSRWPPGAGGRWWPRCRSSTASRPCWTRTSR
jgi:D-aminopeptidase